jgi:ketosteroid isomerase-like protein
MTVQALHQVARQWMDAFNNKDLEKLLSLYDDHSRHFSPKLKVRHPETQGLIVGKQALRNWWSDAFNRLPTLSYQLVRLTAEENRVFLEYVRRVDGEEDLFVGEMLELREGLIIASAVFHR